MSTDSSSTTGERRAAAEPGTAILGVDAGQSGSRFLLVRSDGSRAAWTGRGLPSGVSPIVALGGFLLENACRTDLLGSDRIVGVGAGMTGFHAGVHGLAASLLPAWSQRLGAHELRLADDAVTSYLGALGDRDGAVVAAGTGVTVLARGSRTPAVRVNGWGPTLGDEGGGYWVGQEGLRSAYRYLDGRTGSEQLAELARESFGDLAHLPAALAQSPRRVSDVARFSRQVARAALAGDVVARGIWERAAGHLAEAVAAAVDAVTRARSSGVDAPLPVSYTGALFEAGPLLLEPFEAELGALRTPVTLTPPEADAVSGSAALFALRDPDQFRDLLDVATNL
jgi:N-acetylglucosamine kinase-like BadF-type ATPase